MHIWSEVSKDQWLVHQESQYEYGKLTENTLKTIIFYRENYYNNNDFMQVDTVIIGIYASIMSPMAFNLTQPVKDYFYEERSKIRDGI